MNDDKKMDTEFTSALDVHLFKNVEFNFDKEMCQKILQKYVKPEHLKNSCIAGGFFTKYNKHALFSVAFPDIYRQFSVQSSVDIFLLADNWNALNREFGKKFFIFLYIYF